MSVLVAIAHNLTPAQTSELNELGHVALLREAHPELFAKLSNTPGITSELEKLVSQFLDVCQDYTTVVLPIGSPAFNHILALQGGLNFASKVVYAHSERKSIEVQKEDGTVEKKTVFEHQYFFNI